MLQTREEGGEPGISPGYPSYDQIAAIAAIVGGLSSVFAAKAPPPTAAQLAVPSLTKRDAELILDATFDRIYRRVPAPTKKNRPGEQCPFTGLNRGQFYELFKLREKGKPLIRNVSLREQGEKHGARFYHVGDALRYLDRLARGQESA